VGDVCGIRLTNYLSRSGFASLFSAPSAILKVPGLRLGHAIDLLGIF